MELGEQIVARCRELAAVSEEHGRLTRRFATPAMARANALVGAWMREAGMTVRIDAAGNLVGRRPGDLGAAGTLLLGSHLDTVRDAGAFDGPLGVLAAIALRAAAARGGRRAALRRSTCSASPTRRACASAPPTSAAARWPGASSPRCWTRSTTTA